jgi:glycosyltransferase involved in cell wall biosynthesis
MQLCNRGLREREGDAVLLSGGTLVTQGWLGELAAVAHSEERTASATPLINETGSCSALYWTHQASPSAIDETTVRAACSGLPRWTTIPKSDGLCIYLRGDVLDAVGELDSSFTGGSLALDDWTMRAQAIGFFAKRANHVFVSRCWSNTEESVLTASTALERSTFESRHPELEHQVVRFRDSLDGRLASHAIRLESVGKIRVAFDLRHLPAEQVGTRTYAVGLGRALAELPGIELTLLAQWPAQAEGLKGRLVLQEDWSNDVAVIHKPAQVFDSRQLRLLFESSAHVIITYQDLIAYRIPANFKTEVDFDRYRTTSGLSIQAAQHIIAYSETARREIAVEFGTPPAEISVIPLGVEAPLFARRDPDEVTISRRLGLPKRYFFSLATDYPHKNLAGLLDAYVLLRSRWTDGDPPGLVLAGYSMGSRVSLYARLESQPQVDGLIFLGPVSAEELRVLYRQAEALVFPSFYEGFGLTPLEAMAAGTPVIAMPFSSIPEVGGDCVLYPNGLSAADLARAMEHLATNETLRDELRELGLRRVEQFTWEKTALSTLEVYRSAVLRPAERSLQMRRLLRDAVIHWSQPASPAPPPVVIAEPEPMGIWNSCKALNLAMHRRMQRELKRLPPSRKRRLA